MLFTVPAEILTISQCFSQGVPLVGRKSTDNWLCQLDGLLCLGGLSGPELCLVIESEAIDDSCEPFYNLLIADY